jgi:hypothetical protein
MDPVLFAHDLQSPFIASILAFAASSPNLINSSRLLVRPEVRDLRLDHNIGVVMLISRSRA